MIKFLENKFFIVKIILQYLLNLIYRKVRAIDSSFEGSLEKLSMPDIPGKLLSLFSSRVEWRDGSYIIEVPENEIDEGHINEGETYSIGIIEGTDEGENKGVRLQPPVEEGEMRYVEVEDIGKQGDGIARVERGYVIIVPDADIGDRVKVEIEEVKENFALAKVIEEENIE